MKRIARVLLVAWAVCSPALFAQDSFVGQGRSSILFCDNEILSGHYAVSITGTRPAPLVLPAFPGVPVGTIEQVTGVFILIFDGNGSIRMGSTPTVKGSLSGLFPDQPGTGTYSVNPDCSGTFTINLPQLPAPLVNNMVIQNGGKEFRSVVVSPQPVMVSVTAAQIK